VGGPPRRIPPRFIVGVVPDPDGHFSEPLIRTDFTDCADYWVVRQLGCRELSAFRPIFALEHHMDIINPTRDFLDKLIFFSFGPASFPK
jgi:hypothetical protein